MYKKKLLKTLQNRKQGENKNMKIGYIFTNQKVHEDMRETLFLAQWGYRLQSFSLYCKNITEFYFPPLLLSQAGGFAKQLLDSLYEDENAGDNSNSKMQGMDIVEQWIYRTTTHLIMTTNSIPLQCPTT